MVHKNGSYLFAGINSFMIINRELSINPDESILLLGPRGTGKSTLLKQHFDPASCLWIDLLKASTEEKYSKNPDILISEVQAMSEDQAHIIIDEVQKVPKLLDIAHFLIEETGKYFVMSGSSARKIKTNAANLLAGRAFVYHLAPLTFQELGDRFELIAAMSWGMLPKVYQYEDERQKKRYLQSYALTYLKQEIWGEQVIRNLNPFRYFLEVAAQCNGKVINFSKIARDVGVDYKTVENYYSILEDTFVGFYLPAYSGSIRKQITLSSKFYLFDTGVARSLARMLSVPVREKTNYFGELFEQFIVVEIRKMIEYNQNEYRLSFLRTKTDMEIDVIVQRPGRKTLLIEIKSSDDVQREQLNNFESLIGEIPDSEAICFSRDTNKKVFGDITVWPWKEGLLHFFS